jgi:hypothetical protein
VRGRQIPWVCVCEEVGRSKLSRGGDAGVEWCWEEMAIMCIEVR